jgi:hypothetical protein
MIVLQRNVVYYVASVIPDGLWKRQKRNLQANSRKFLPTNPKYKLTGIEEWQCL